jgi:hypothetical protein
MKRVKKTMDEFHFEIAHTIAKDGRQIIGVIPDRKHAGFAYTIGNHSKGVPELLLIGNFAPENIKWVLNDISDRLIKRGKPFDNGSTVDLGGKHPLMVWNCTEVAKSEFLIQAGEYFGHSDYLVQQVVIPDPQGRWPDDILCHKDYRVPLLKRIEVLH